MEVTCKYKPGVWPLLLLMMCAFITASCIEDHENNGKEVSPAIRELEIGDTIPDFEVKMNDGKVMESQSLRGKIAVIVFFHTKCGDCQQELPEIQQLYEAGHPQVEIVCISRAETAPSIEEYWKGHRLTLPYSAQEDAGIYHLFAESVIPRVYITDKNGVIHRIFTDESIVKCQDMLNIIDKLLE